MKRHAGFLLGALLILLTAHHLRSAHRDWDGGHLLHPDERFLCMVTADLESPASLREFFDTAASPLNPHNVTDSRFVYGTLPVFLVHRATQRIENPTLTDIARTGRRLSALWSTATVLLVILLARRWVSAPFALWTGGLAALSFLCIQQSHFYTIDTAAGFFATLTLGLGLTATRENRPLFLIPAGLATGLAMACRLNLGLLGLWLIVCAISLHFRRRNRRALPCLFAGGALALLAFRIAQPYAFLGFGLNPEWLADLRIEHAIVSGQLEVPYTLQWVGRLPGLYPLGQLIQWGLGLPLGLLAVGGALWTLWTLRNDPGHWAVLLVLWPLMLLLFHSRYFLQTLRYLLPAVPALILAGSLILQRLTRGRTRTLIFAGITLATALHVFILQSIHREPHPRIQASEWLLDQCPVKVTYEVWDDPLPLRLPDRRIEHANITFTGLPVSDPETPEKWETILSAINQADFIVLSSNRLSASIPRLPLRYPVTTRFYEALFSGELGLEPAARFHNTPALGPLRLNTLRAEEAFTVYDNPEVLIFRRTPDWDKTRAKALLTEGIDFHRIPDIRFTDGGRWNGGWFTPSEWEKRQNAPPFASRFDPRSLGNRNPLLIWTLVLFLIGLAAAPVTWFLFPALPARGLFLRRLTGLLMISHTAWLLSATGLVPFGTAILLATALLFLASGLLFALHGEELLAAFRRHVRTALFGETVWWSVFFIFLGLRWMQPELWHPWAGGEKPMDFAFLNATAQTSWFPPHNPWLSGAFINYYYYGFVLVATLIRMTGISPDIAYNLALPTFAAFAAGGILSLVYAFHPLLRTRQAYQGRRPAALLAVLIILISGNLGQLRWLASGTTGHPRDGYWQASRVLRVPSGEIEPITEFPFFSFLYGDLHAHVMALPLAMLTLLASWQLLRRPKLRHAIVCGVLLGTLRVTNTWDVPVQAAVFTAAALFPLLKSRRPLTAWHALGRWTAGLLVSQFAFLPFFLRNASYPARFLLWDGPRSRLFDLFLAHGLFLLPLALTLPLLLRDPILRRAPRTHRLLPAALLGGCLLLILLVEFITLDGDIGRMNTVFKFYYQIWWILGLLTALAVTAALKAARDILPAILALAICSLGLVYPATAIHAKQRDRVWTQPRTGLDGLAYLEHATYETDGHLIPLADDLRAIRWLRANASPLDIVIEAHRPEYQWGGRISWHTGNPTLLGWAWHMRQQRPRPGGEQAVYERQHDLIAFYTAQTAAEAHAIARRHNARFVVFGELERLTYGAGAQNIFEDTPFFRPVFRYGAVSIYEILVTS
jgi:uncharacterized membrane protein